MTERTKRGVVAGAIARTINSCPRKRFTARVWTKESQCRIYVTTSPSFGSQPIGYLEVSLHGSVKSRLSRHSLAGEVLRLAGEATRECLAAL